MKTILHDETRAELNARLAALRPDSAARWGKFNCVRMLSHVADGLRLCLGELTAKPKQTPFRYSPLKQFVIYWIPFPKGAPTAPELLARAPESCESECAAVTELMTKIATRAPGFAWNEHPLFGRMTRKQWGVLAYRHIDHHLRQFGV